MFSKLVSIGLISLIPLSSQAIEFESFQGLGDLPGGIFNSVATDVSADGSVIIGTGISENGTEAFRYEDGVMTGLGSLDLDDRGRPSDIGSDAFSISADGSIIVGQGEVAGDFEAFIYQNGIISSLGNFFLPGGTERFRSFPIATNFASDVSADGLVIVGTGFISSNTFSEPFIYENGQVTPLSSINEELRNGVATAVSNDGSMIVGFTVAENNVDVEAFRYENDQVISLGSLIAEGDSTALNISADGSVIIGSSDSENGIREAFRYENGVITGLGDLPGGNFDSTAFGASEDGSIIVGEGASENGLEAFIWNEVDGIQSLQELLLEASIDEINGWQLQQALNISDDGSTIVGFGINPDGNTEAFMVRLSQQPATVVPLSLWSYALFFIVLVLSCLQVCSRKRQLQ